SLEQVQRHVEQLEFFLSRVAQGGIMLKIYGEETLKRLVDEQLQALYRLLIEPLPLRFSGQPLVVVPHGVLHAVPFAALFDGERYLLDRAEVSFTPSAAVYALCRKRKRLEAAPLVAFGVSLEHIPQTLEEVEQIGRIFQNAHIFMGERATLENFFTAAPQAGVLHIATHGAFRPDNPMFSGLRLADGWLAARDLYSLRLKAELVVLSACETGLGKQVRGEGLVGLTRAFLYAGARAVLVSLWKVADVSTAELMVRLYRHLKAGQSKAEALRRARLELLQEEGFVHPFYWAPFILVGRS
ncbi:MAG: CHAT domain-containing protein, partial [Blastocatellia bacterium]|nr:CHAT domain-containing protein [Blastocatellia bacterium]